MSVSDISQIAGFLGAIVSVCAYIPQITHLIKEKCSEGISIKAFAIWLVASMLLLFHSIVIQSIVFILFQSGSLIAIAIIVLFGYRYRHSTCRFHQHKLHTV